LPERASDLIFSIHVRTTRDLAKFGSLVANLVDEDTGASFATFDAGNSHAHHHPEALIMCSAYRLKDGLWRANSLGMPCRGTSRDYRPLLNKLQALGYPRNVSMQHQVPAMLAGMQAQLNMGYAPKATKVIVDDSSTMTTHYSIESFERDQKPEDISIKIQKRTFQDAVDESLRGSGGDRFAKTKVELTPTAIAQLTHYRLQMKWDFPNSDENSNGETPKQSGNYLDTTCFAFEERQLSEVVDYRGPHGVRIIHNGIIDYAGLWVGVTGVGDATGGAVRHSGEDLDYVNRLGTNTMDVQFELLPKTTTDLYFVLSASVLMDVGRYPSIQMSVQDANNVGHEITSCQLNTAVLGGSPSAVMCRLSKTADEESWKFTPVRAGTKGSVYNDQELIYLLRAMQEMNYPTVPAWPYMDPNELACRKQERKQMWSLQTHRMRQQLADLKGDTCAMDHEYRRNSMISINSRDVEDFFAIDVRQQSGGKEPLGSPNKGRSSTRDKNPALSNVHPT